jgi:hypothetical protein
MNQASPGFLKIASMLLTFLILRGLFELITGDFMLSLFPAWDTVILSSAYRIPILVVLILLSGALVAGVFSMVRKVVNLLYFTLKK